MSKKNQTQIITEEKTALQAALEEANNAVEVAEPININTAEGQELATSFDTETVQLIINNRPFINVEGLLKAIPKLTPHIDGLVDKGLILFSPVADNTATEQPKPPVPPTREERLSQFKTTYGKLITATYEDTFNLLWPIVDKVTQGQLSEHPKVTEAKEAIANLEAKLSQLDSLPDDIARYASIGIRAEIAQYAATIESLKGSNPLAEAMLEQFWFELYDRGLLPKGKVSKRKTGKRSASVAFDSKSLVAFSYQTKRTLKDGTTLEVPLTKGYLVGDSHPKVTEANLNIAPGYLGIFSESGILMGKVNASESKGSILGTAVVVLVGGDESKVKAISGTGIAALDQNGAANKVLLAHVPELKASLLSNGRNSELASQTIGTREMAVTA